MRSATIITSGKFRQIRSVSAPTGNCGIPKIRRAGLSRRTTSADNALRSHKLEAASALPIRPGVLVPWWRRSARAAAGGSQSFVELGSTIAQGARDTGKRESMDRNETESCAEPDDELVKRQVEHGLANPFGTRWRPERRATRGGQRPRTQACGHRDTVTRFLVSDKSGRFAADDLLRNSPASADTQDVLEASRECHCRHRPPRWACPKLEKLPLPRRAKRIHDRGRCRTFALASPRLESNANRPRQRGSLRS
jgi:hypothetical protein